MPLALPDPATVIHDAGLATVHVHPAPVVTVIVPVPPVAFRVSEAGLTLNVQAAAACVTVNVFPAIVSVAERDAVVVFAAAVKSAVPPPLPVAPLVIVTHEAALVAFQVQPAPVVTVTAPVPPVAATDWLVEEMAYEQAPACVRVNADPAIVSVPTRLVVAVFAEKPNATVPVPEPEAPDVRLIQELLLAAVHAQPAAAVTALLPEPADAITDWLAGEIEGVPHVGVNENVLDRAAALVPPGPTAATRAS